MYAWKRRLLLSLSYRHNLFFFNQVYSSLFWLASARTDQTIPKSAHKHLSSLRHILSTDTFTTSLVPRLQKEAVVIRLQLMFITTLSNLFN